MKKFNEAEMKQKIANNYNSWKWHSNKGDKLYEKEERTEQETNRNL